MIPLPRIMVAPNGARRTKADHPALPVSIPEVVATARACFDAGADGLHAHVRDDAGMHALDAGLYRELLAEMATAVPQMQVQITTEAVGRYSPAEQRALVDAVRPRAVSIALREMLADDELALVRQFYGRLNEAEVSVQHILYDALDVRRLVDLVTSGAVPQNGLQVLLVLGRYSDGMIATPDDLQAPLDGLRELDRMPDWAVCAFGPQETACLMAGQAAGSKVRVGFENNLMNANGELAVDNAERVAEIVQFSKRSSYMDRRK